MDSPENIKKYMDDNVWNREKGETFALNRSDSDDFIKNEMKKKNIRQKIWGVVT